MKRFLIAAVALLALNPVMPVSRAGQKQSSPSFAPFWTGFKAAVARGDKAAVASMTKLPFLFSGEERSSEGFVKIFDELFPRKVKRCFATSKPVKDNESYAVFCSGTIYYFAMVDGKYMFTEIGADD